MAKDGQARETRVRVEAWWKALQEKGEQGLLVETVSQGGPGTSSALLRLLERYPAAVPDAVVSGLPRVIDARERFYVIQALSEVADPRVVDLLAKEAGDGPTIDCRVRAALNASAHGRAEMRAVLLAEWARLLEAPPTHDLPFGVSLLVGYLLDGRADGIRAVAAALPGLAPGLVDQMLFRYPSQVTGDPESALGLEDLYASLLDDDVKIRDVAGADDRTVAVRLCDRAAEALARLRVGRDVFDSAADVETRDRQIRAMQDDWRARRKLGPVERPPRASELADGDVVPAVERVLAARDEAQRTAAAAALVALGLRAVPAIRRAVARSPAARETLAPVLRTLRSTVARVEGRGVGAALTDRLRSMEGRSLNPASSLELLRSTLTRVPRGRVRVRLTAHWLAEGRGVALLLEIRPLLGSLGEEITWSTTTSAAGLSREVGGSRIAGRGPPDPADTESFASLLAAAIDDESASPTVDALLMRHP